MAECKFCGKDEVLTKEHAWPAWALKYVEARTIPNDPIDGVSHRIRRTSLDGDETVWPSRAGVQLRDACKTCNNVRMGAFEVEAAPLLKPLIRGAVCLVTTEQLEIIARWCVKNAMVWELALRVPGTTATFFTQAERQGLILERKIPERTSVSLSHFIGGTPTGMAWAQALDLIPPGQTESRKVFCATISLGQLVTQIVTHRDELQPALESDYDPSQREKQIWPARHNLRWPPKWNWDRDGLREYAKFGKHGAAPPR